jgi:hypothetical protein
MNLKCAEFYRDEFYRDEVYRDEFQFVQLLQVCRHLTGSWSVHSSSLEARCRARKKIPPKIFARALRRRATQSMALVDEQSISRRSRRAARSVRAREERGRKVKVPLATRGCSAYMSAARL